MLIGNKADLLEDTGEVIDPKEPQIFAEKESATFISTSAKTGLNLDSITGKSIMDMFSKLWEKNKDKLN